MPSVTRGHGVVSPTTQAVERPTADGPTADTVVWDQEQPEDLREAREDAELTVSVDSVPRLPQLVGRFGLDREHLYWSARVRRRARAQKRSNTCHSRPRRPAAG
jgi:hypothetical protein